PLNVMMPAAAPREVSIETHTPTNPCSAGLSAADGDAAFASTALAGAGASCALAYESKRRLNRAQVAAPARVRRFRFKVTIERYRQRFLGLTVKLRGTCGTELHHTAGGAFAGVKTRNGRHCNCRPPVVGINPSRCDPSACYPLTWATHQQESLWIQPKTRLLSGTCVLSE